MPRVLQVCEDMGPLSRHARKLVADKHISQNRSEPAYISTDQEDLRDITANEKISPEAPELKPPARQLLAWLVRVSCRSPRDEPSADPR